MKILATPSQGLSMMDILHMFPELNVVMVLLVPSLSAVYCMLQFFEPGVFWSSFSVTKGSVTDSCSLYHLLFINIVQFPIPISDGEMRQQTLLHVSNPKLSFIHLPGHILFLYSYFK